MCCCAAERYLELGVVGDHTVVEHHGAGVRRLIGIGVRIGDSVHQEVFRSRLSTGAVPAGEMDVFGLLHHRAQTVQVDIVEVCCRMGAAVGDKIDPIAGARNKVLALRRQRDFPLSAAVQVAEALVPFKIAVLLKNQHIEMVHGNLRAARLRLHQRQGLRSYVEDYAVALPSTGSAGHLLLDARREHHHQGGGE